MTPAEHIAQAELLVDMAMQTDDPGDTAKRNNLYTSALAHGVIAIAVELGVPHSSSGTAVPGAG